MNQLERQATAVLQQLSQSLSDLKLIVGVSGGADSLALLHILRQLLSPQQLVVAHLVHGLRPSAVDEAAFVQKMAVAWQIAYFIREVDVGQLARAKSWSLEEAGRHARYAFFAELAVQEGATAVAVAHNADDQSETVLMHLLRGTGLDGLRGMRSLSPLPGKPELLLVRPLLQSSHATIETYCQEQALQPILDESNRDMRYFRNRVRHQLLPFLADYNPQVKRHLQQLAEVAAADTDYLNQLTDDAWNNVVQHAGTTWLYLDKAIFLGLPLSLQRRVLRRGLHLLRPSLTDLSFRTIELALKIITKDVTGTQAPLPGNLTLSIGYGHLEVKTKGHHVPHNLPQLVDETLRPLSIPGQITLGNGWLLRADSQSDFDLPAVTGNRDPWLAMVDVGAAEQLFVRPREPGERFQPLGMDGKTASVQDVLVNRKLAADLRPLWPIVALPEHLVWLVGQQLDERARVTAVSRRVVQLRCWRQADANGA